MPANVTAEKVVADCSCGKNCQDNICASTQATGLLNLALSTIDANIVEKRVVKESAQRVSTRSGAFKAHVKK